MGNQTSKSLVKTPSMKRLSLKRRGKKSKDSTALNTPKSEDSESESWEAYRYYKNLEKQNNEYSKRLEEMAVMMSNTQNRNLDQADEIKELKEKVEITSQKLFDATAELEVVADEQQEREKQIQLLQKQFEES